MSMGKKGADQVDLFVPHESVRKAAGEPNGSAQNQARQLPWRVELSVSSATLMVAFYFAEPPKMIANAGIRHIVLGEFYRDERTFDFAQQLGIQLVGIDGERPL